MSRDRESNQVVWTAGGWPFQVTKQDEVLVRLSKSTRIQPSACQVRTCHPGSGVAETNRAEVAPRSSTTRPPVSW